MYERGTGGGPNKTQKLSGAEEAIFQLLGMKESVEGIESTQCYGLPSKRVKVNSDVEILSEIVVQCEEAPGCSTDFLTSIQDSEPPVPQCQSECSPKGSSKQPVPQSSQNTNSAIKLKKITSNELVVQELETQQELCGKVGETLSEMKSHNNEMQYYGKKIYRTLERICDQKEKKLNEIKRHNFEMEKMRKIEIESLIENNRKTLELKELKLEILRKGKSKN